MKAAGGQEARLPGPLDPPEMAKPLGVSIVLCCHNSAGRLPQTLTRLASQRTSGRFDWEVVVVDNASSDGTAETAARIWPREHPIPLRLLFEPKLGVAYARAHALTHAAYELVSFVDDDNWVGPEWVETVVQVSREHPEAGAIGGTVAAAPESAPPPWFERYKDCFAIGPDLDGPCDATEEPGVLWTAGLTLRKSAWDQLREKGFDFTLPSRQGTVFTGGEDNELCLALRLAGWKLWYDPRLQLHHFLPMERLEWRHLRYRARGTGISSVGLDPYVLCLRQVDPKTSNLRRIWDRRPGRWVWQALSSTAVLLRHPLTLALMAFLSLEGSDQVLQVEAAFGRLTQLLKMRTTYDLAARQICSMSWKAGKP